MGVIDTVYIANESLLFIQDYTSSNSTFFERHFSDITSLIEVFLIGIYVFYTIKSFKELKKQTDLQLKAYLNAENSLLNDKDLKSNLVNIKNFDSNFSKDWKETMEKAFPALSNSDIFEGGYYTLELTNYGNTEIKSFYFHTIVDIKNSEESINKKKLKPEERKIFKLKLNHILKKERQLKYHFFQLLHFQILKYQQQEHIKV